MTKESEMTVKICGSDWKKKGMKREYLTEYGRVDKSE